MDIEASRLAAYADRYQISFGSQLGAGANGAVYSTSRRNAVKFFYTWQDEAYHRERRAYIIIQEQNVREVCGHRVPLLIRHDDELLAVEMSTVAPPYLLDFASAYLLDEVPDFPDEVWEQHHADVVERFGSYWPRASEVINEFEAKTGLILLDPHLSNLKFA